MDIWFLLFGYYEECHCKHSCVKFRAGIAFICLWCMSRKRISGSFDNSNVTTWETATHLTILKPRQPWTRVSKCPCPLHQWLWSNLLILPFRLTWGAISRFRRSTVPLLRSVTTSQKYRVIQIKSGLPWSQPWAYQTAHVLMFTRFALRKHSLQFGKFQHSSAIRARGDFLLD